VPRRNEQTVLFPRQINPPNPTDRIRFLFFFLRLFFRGIEIVIVLFLAHSRYRVNHKCLFIYEQNTKRETILLVTSLVLPGHEGRPLRMKTPIFMLFGFVHTLHRAATIVIFSLYSTYSYVFITDVTIPNRVTHSEVYRTNVCQFLADFFCPRSGRLISTSLLIHWAQFGGRISCSFLTPDL